MNSSIIFKNINKTIVFSNLPLNDDKTNYLDVCKKLRKFLKVNFGSVKAISFYERQKKEDCFLFITFENEFITNKVREAWSLNSNIFNGIYYDQQKTIKELKVKCIYKTVSEKYGSNVLRITNVPNDIKDNNIHDIFEREGKFLYYDLEPTEYGTVTLYVYYPSVDVAKIIKNKMNRGEIVNHKIEIEFCQPRQSTCICISNIHTFNSIDKLIEKFKRFGKIKELEINEKSDCMYVNFTDISCAIDLKNEISDNSFFNDFENNIKADFYLPALDYKLLSENKPEQVKESEQVNDNDSDGIQSYEDYINNSPKRIKQTEETKNESSESRSRRSSKRRNRFKSSNFFDTDDKTDTKTENKEEIKDVITKESYSNTKTESKEEKTNLITMDNSNTKEEVIEINESKDSKYLKKEVKDEDIIKPKILDERKPINRSKLLLLKFVNAPKYKIEICYKDTRLNMEIFNIDGDKDKPYNFFGKKTSLSFQKMKKDEVLFSSISERLGMNGDSSWSFCIGCIDDEGDYTEKMKADFENIKILNDKFKKKDNWLYYKENDTNIALLPSNFHYLYLLEQVFVNDESNNEKYIKDALGKWDFFIFIIFNVKSDFN